MMNTIDELTNLYQLGGLKRADYKFISDEAFKLLENPENMPKLVKFYGRGWCTALFSLNCRSKHFNLLKTFIEHGYDSDYILGTITRENIFRTKKNYSFIKACIEKMLSRDPNDIRAMHRLWELLTQFDNNVEADELSHKIYKLAIKPENKVFWTKSFIEHYERRAFPPTYESLDTEHKFYIGAFLTACEEVSENCFILMRELSPQQFYSKKIIQCLEDKNVIIKKNQHWEINIKDFKKEKILHPDIEWDDMCLHLWREMAFLECVEFMMYYKLTFELDDVYYKAEGELILNLLKYYDPSHIFTLIRKALKEALASKVEHGMSNSTASKCFLNNLTRYHQWLQEGKWTNRYQHDRQWMQTAASEFLSDGFLKFNGFKKNPKPIKFTIDKEQEESLH